MMHRALSTLMLGALLTSVPALAQTSSVAAGSERMPAPGSPVLPSSSSKTSPSDDRPLPLSIGNGAVSTGLSGYYDYQSNGMSPDFIHVQPGDESRVHVTYMLASDPSNPEGQPSRRVGYAISTDGGATWRSTQAIQDIRMGFPAVRAHQDGNAYIVAHGENPEGPAGLLYSRFLSTDVPNSTTFLPLINLPQTTESGRTRGVIWPTFRFSKDYSKAVFLGSYTNDTDDPQAPLQTTVLDLNTGGIGQTWSNLTDSMLSATSGGRAALARSPGGKIGAAWYRFGGTDDQAAAGLYFAESTDDGATWGEPSKIFGGQLIDQFNLNDDIDTLTGGTHIDLGYLGEDPHIVFTGSVNFLYRFESIFHWSASDPVSRQIATVDFDSGRGAYTWPVGKQQPNMSGITYPSISIGDDGEHIVVAFGAVASYINATRDTISPVTSENGFLYYRIWGVGSSDGGATWGDARLLQDFVDDAGDTMNVEYPALNDVAYIMDNGNIQTSMVFQGRREPGMYTFTAENQESGPVSEAGLYFQRNSLEPGWFASVAASVDSRIAASGSLRMSPASPNPASTTSTLRYSVARAGTGSLMLVDQLGRELLTLERRHAVPGEYELQLDLSSIASGQYRLVLRQDGGVVSQPLNVVR